MIKKIFKMSLVMLSVLSCTTQAFSVVKQLAGSANEFSLMKAADPAHSSIRSKSAMLPITFKKDADGSWLWETELAIDSDNFKFLIFSNGQKNWDIQMRDPVTHLQQKLTPRQSQSIDKLKTKSKNVKYGIPGREFPAEEYSFKNLQQGSWKLSIRAKNLKNSKGFLLVGGNSKYRLNSYKSRGKQVVGSSLYFVSEAMVASRGHAQLKSANILESSYLRITSPDGQQIKGTMYDDGLHGDQLANDGIWGGEFVPKMTGNYNVQVVARGTNPEGSPFLRTVEHLVPVITQSIQLGDSAAKITIINSNRLAINLDVTSISKFKGQTYRVIAEVWGSSKKSKKKLPVSWLSTITEVDEKGLNLELDTGWIARAGVQAPFELRNLRIEDTDHYIAVVSAKVLPIQMDLQSAALSKNILSQEKNEGKVTEEMLRGRKPSVMASIASPSIQVASSGLLLVHGYCSSDVWGPVSSQFTGEKLFLDLNANRSHDDFARRIRNFGNSLNSFGIVAHSQGGAASLHLYSYYWSGLDNATGNRMIQSVGTPYQGTPLAGNLALIGSIFGAGCGVNTNLTPSGAANWLAGIPSWARSKVYYHTTSFSTKWWRYDYCSIATDLFLSDPEDGVVEKSRGQLSGAHNMGHKKGWCHTTGMRDTAQSRDSSRNYNMDQNAMR